MSVTCEVCRKPFGSPTALGAHAYWAHGLFARNVSKTDIAEGLRELELRLLRMSDSDLRQLGFDPRMRRVATKHIADAQQRLMQSQLGKTGEAPGGSWQQIVLLFLLLLMLTEMKKDRGR